MTGLTPESEAGLAVAAAEKAEAEASAARQSADDALLHGNLTDASERFHDAWKAHAEAGDFWSAAAQHYRHAAYAIERRSRDARAAAQHDRVDGQRARHHAKEQKK